MDFKKHMDFKSASKEGDFLAKNLVRNHKTIGNISFQCDHAQLNGHGMNNHSTYNFEQRTDLKLVWTSVPLYSLLLCLPRLKLYQVSINGSGHR